uniref:Uncharacterized protein n=1 Tax=Pyxicephalus adspersus TaxID=30357 RepID=A0AAV3AIN1_PYXAD|nr:TPA: hypothetical protein GDO54_011968 [Pyxicephalus adspersus]
MALIYFDDVLATKALQYVFLHCQCLQRCQNELLYEKNFGLKLNLSQNCFCSLYGVRKIWNLYHFQKKKEIPIKRTHIIENLTGFLTFPHSIKKIKLILPWVCL